MLVLDRSATESLLDLDALRAALRPAMQDVSAGRASVPPRTAAMVPERGFLASMPAHLPSAGLAAKLVSLFPGNAGGRLPTHQAVVLVFDPDSGEPLALLDGTSVTALRTAAGSALSAELLAREDAATLTVLGTGVQARAHAEALVRVRTITELRVAGRSLQRAEALASELRRTLELDVRAVEGYGPACAGADIVCAATHSPEPVVERHHLAPGTHVTSVGFNTQGREVDSATMRDALVVVESRAAVLAPPPTGSTDVRAPLEEGLVKEEDLVEVGELLLGMRIGRTSRDQITLYKSVGVAAQDVAAAALVLRGAREQGLGQHIDLSA